MKRSYMMHYEAEGKSDNGNTIVYSGIVAIRKNEMKQTTDIIIDYIESGKDYEEVEDLKITLCYKVQ